MGRVLSLPCPPEALRVMQKRWGGCLQALREARRQGSRPQPATDTEGPREAVLEMLTEQLLAGFRTAERQQQNVMVHTAAHWQVSHVQQAQFS